LLISLIHLPGIAGTRMTGDLPRTDGKPLENLAGVDTEYGELRTSDGARLRTIVTRPQGSTGRLPAIQYVQPLSCDTIEVSSEGGDGWNRMLRAVITRSNALVLRVEKSGVGDSRGLPCSQLDYETELAHHRAALRHLRSRPDVDGARVVVFGGSMGSNYAPLVARGQSVAGVAVWGGGARTWYERQIAFDRRALELSGKPANEMPSAMMRYAEYEFLYLQKGMSPTEIARQRPDLADVWEQIVGTSGNLQYGRPLAFHQQAQRQTWTAAWAEVKVPVLVLLGEYDWFEEPRSAELIALVVNRRAPGSAEYHLIPGMDHHFSLFPSAQAAFIGKDGTADPKPALDYLMPWLENRLRATSR
jgi:pimeloyl-ACP methyl ester carboxylesterase